MLSTLSANAWQDESELALVRDWFYPDRAARDPYGSLSDVDMRREAIASVNIWTFRSHKVPPAVLATADLSDSIIHWEELERTGDCNLYRSVQFMFAFAFLRFVNGFVDRDIARAKNATLSMGDDETDEEGYRKISGESSMYAHAVTIGMPERFVDLRHQVTHGKVPDLMHLKKAADEALNWLWDRWWKTNATGDSAAAARRFIVRHGS